MDKQSETVTSLLPVNHLLSRFRTVSGLIAPPCGGNQTVGLTEAVQYTLSFAPKLKQNIDPARGS